MVRPLFALLQLYSQYDPSILLPRPPKSSLGYGQFRQVDEGWTETLATLTERLRAQNGRALILPASYGNIPFAELDAWIDAHGGRRLPSHMPQLHRMGERAVTHTDEGYEAKTLTFDSPVSPAKLEALLHDAGPGLCRAKGIIPIEGEGVCIVQYAAGQLEITPAPEQNTLDLVLIGTGLKV